MPIANLSQSLPSLGSIVDRQPLIVAPTLPLVKVISLMSQAKGDTCQLPNSEPIRSSALEVSATARHSAVLILEDHRLIGIFTERDLVKFTASQTDLQGVEVGDVMTAKPISLVLSPQHTIMTALGILQQHQLRHLPILDEQQQLLGIVTPEHIRQALQPVNLLKYRLVSEGVTKSVVHALPTSTILEIAQMMVEGNIGSIVIVDGQEPLSPVGIVTERDIVQFQAFGLDLDQLLVQAVMSSPLFCLQSRDSLWAAQQIMQAKNIRRLVIVNDRGELEGILTQSNLLQLLDPLEMLYMMDILQSQLVNRATELEQTNRELQAEVVRREQVEAKLRRASQILEERVVARTAESAMLSQKLQFTIAEQQSCDVALEASQQGISDFIEHAIIGMNWVDVEGNIVWVNQAELEMFGFDRSEYLGEPLINFHVDRSKIADVLRRVTNHESVTGFESQVYHKDGSICNISLDAHGFFKDGKPIHIRCFSRNITAQQTALHERQQLAQERDRFHSLGSDLQVIANSNGYYTWVSPTFEPMLGWTTEEMTSSPWIEFVHPDDIAPSVAEETSLFSGNETMKFENRYRHKDGSYRWLSWKAKSYPQEQSIYAVAVDITDKKQLEQQFFRAQRLESLGSLASGIAHDLNNVLTPILGAAQLLPLTLPSLDARNQRLLNMLVESSRRGSGLVKQILSFARGIDGERQSLQVRHILAEIISVARQTFPKSIDINLNLDREDLWMVNVDATQIHQVLMNLVVNARDAILTTGEITASAENIVIDAVYSDRPIQLPVGFYILITITDTGIGMNDQILGRIFEPFFTTKETGTGLGLSTVLGIVKAHGGSIEVESQVGGGSCFKVYLPAIDAQEVQAQSIDAVRHNGKGQLVLVVDDEAAIREIAKESLEEYNYRVILASEGIEAIDIYAQNYHSIAIVVIDMMMPHLDTPSIVLTLQQINPQVQIVVMSGSFHDLKSILDPHGIKEFLTKPFTAAEMIQALTKIQIQTES